ncbi:hypothetical protein B0J13DRAFT_529541 [Dactylonectria estremocensis]|uniref:Uncharacterized protein n=1 Tax=Dactylonectria estremocensis TaxID=1079267 RepID=A0A9P9E514_9HYPO|nr:hypothetical protein B0J13DRAFT_529541 [Dactylonectria estremocensis]
MRVLSIGFSLLAAPSFVYAGPCHQPSHSSSQVSVSDTPISTPISQTPTLTSISETPVSTPAPISETPVSTPISQTPTPTPDTPTLDPPLSKFNLVVSNTESTALIGGLLAPADTQFPLRINPYSLAAYSTTFYLEAGTNYLMSHGLYIAWFTLDTIVYTASTASIENFSPYLVHIVCDPAVSEGSVLSCAAEVE